MTKRKAPIKEAVELQTTTLFARIKKEDMKSLVYSNSARVALTNTETNIDFYQVTPTPDATDVIVDHIFRVVMPVSVAKGLVEALANTIARHELREEIYFPSSRGPQEDDSLHHIWDIDDEPQG